MTNNHDYNTFVEYCERGLLEKVKELICNSKGININSKDSFNNTALYAAADNNNLEIVKALISHGAHVNKSVHLDKTALHIASEKGFVKIAKFLIEAGANINAKTTNNVTPLHLASLRGNLEIVEILINEGADVNNSSKHFLSTPLHYSSELKITKLLIKAGTNINSKNIHGYTALDMAKQFDHFQIIEYLENYYAKIIQRGCHNWLWGCKEFNYEKCRDGTVPIQLRIGLRAIQN